MAVIEVGAALATIKTAFDIFSSAKELVSDEQAKDELNKGIDALITSRRQLLDAQAREYEQNKRIGELESELTTLRATLLDLERYELKPIGNGATAYMLKPEHRGSETPHWLCPNCHANGRKSPFVSSGMQVGRYWVHKCFTCQAVTKTSQTPKWVDDL